MKRRIILISGLLITILMSGCAVFSIGATKGSCEENGANYQDTGLCLDPYAIQKNKKRLTDKMIYPEIPCKGRSID